MLSYYDKKKNMKESRWWAAALHRGRSCLGGVTVAGPALPRNQHGRLECGLLEPRPSRETKMSARSGNGGAAGTVTPHWLMARPGGARMPRLSGGGRRRGRGPQGDAARESPSPSPPPSPPASPAPAAPQPPLPPARESPELPLPAGWERTSDYDGLLFYIDHDTNQTSWMDPATGQCGVIDSAPGPEGRGGTHPQGPGLRVTPWEGPGRQIPPPGPWALCGVPRRVQVAPTPSPGPWARCDPLGGSR
ncbi:transcriptional coactivator YAP1-like [Oryctolagus cuniculus]|uniref:transcriptional coactivator YAP1-like n=1 Tax=Oryctolagus cuniculus TaxID=9986 RepID=UPI003879E394